MSEEKEEAPSEPVEAKTVVTVAEPAKTEETKAETPVETELSTPATPAAEKTPITEPPKEMAVIVTDTCPFCKGLKEHLDKEGLGGKVKLINASTPDGYKFAKDHGINAVPECVIIEKEDGNVKVCDKAEFIRLLKGEP